MRTMIFTVRCAGYMILMAAWAFQAGCTIQRGQLDFPKPWFDVQCGTVAVMAFRSSTVLQIGGTYFTLALPFYAPIIFAVILLTALWFEMRRRARA